MSIDVAAGSILREAINIFSNAEAQGLKVPTHVNIAFRNKVSTPQYRDILRTSDIDPESLGRVIGNKHRWDQALCKYFALHFLKFFMERTPRSRFDPAQLTLQYSVPSADDASLLAYEPARYASQFVMFGPTLFLKNNRYITIKIKTMYPNVSKGLDEFQLRWINMRYTKSLNNGNVTLQPVPAFKAKRKQVGKRLETKGQIKGQDGLIANFSYCQLANAFKEACQIALRLLVGDDLSGHSSGDALVPFDLLNLIEKRNTKFRIVTYASKLSGMPLFADTSADEGGSAAIGVRGDYRINGDAEYFFLYGPEEYISQVLDENSLTAAFVGETFRLSRHNLYAGVESGEAVVGLLFQVDRSGDVETKYMSFWEDAKPASIDSYEILDEDQIVDLFGV